MAFIKKIIILNEVTKGYGKAELRGLATVEKSGNQAVCRLTVFNLSDIRLGRFVFGVKCRNLRLQKFELTQTSQNFPLDGETDVDGPISCILVYKYTDRAVPLMWGSTDGKRIFEGNMTDGFMEGAAHAAPPPAAPDNTYRKEEKREEPEKKEETAVNVGTAAAGTAAAEYQDYAVAAENFYPADYGDGRGDVVPDPGSYTACHGDTVPDSTRRETCPHDPAAGRTVSEQWTAVSGQLKGNSSQVTDHSPLTAETGRFYAAIKSQLDELFESYPKEEYLCSKLTGTDWVKVDYDNDGRYYTVGIITEESKVKYICYGVPGKYAKMPPPELKGFCQWLPFDMEKPDGEGYWMMYQDAENGKSVTLEII